MLGVSSHEILLTNEGGTQDGGCAESMTDEEWLGGNKKNWRCLGWKRDGLRQHDTCPPIPEGLSGRRDLSPYYSREQEGDEAVGITP